MLYPLTTRLGGKSWAPQHTALEVNNSRTVAEERGTGAEWAHVPSSDTQMIPRELVTVIWVAGTLPSFWSRLSVPMFAEPAPWHRNVSFRSAPYTASCVVVSELRHAQLSALNGVAS